MATEKFTVEHSGFKYTFPRDVPIRITRELNSVSKVENSDATEEEKTDAILDSSEKLQAFILKHNPKANDRIEDLSVKSLFEIFGEWAKKVQESLPEA